MSRETNRDKDTAAISREEWLTEQLEAQTANAKLYLVRARRLRAERDYYRRRWIMHGISWRGFGAWPKNALAALARASTEDA